ncbi:hypothetical protein [Thermoleptolyngbya sp. M55_K2018_002]|uniref:DUF6930 domain-containing protein n=1 Tax=Thermoleptolyngbya sp. M55_K2018_002 TaxID=2747808 RepID=UPI0019EEAE06|nr:hypothetical protein [Thermoleptolyngbya sp. M55_K2018_002]HIK39928.1 hypothetical protein [Thermoleptolyngbya sp. M55_K2018_002]
MTPLTPSTRRRLQQLPQLSSVWEGDRRTLMPEIAETLDADDMQGDCILWVDGVEEVVRAMDVVPSETGSEAIVRTLLRAMENPHSGSARPGRPQRILVRDRELQFFLRGVLQGLDIAVEYVAELPIIDEIFYGLQDAARQRPPSLPPDYASAVLKAAAEIWQDAPWENLDEEKIFAVELNYGDVGTLYISILGLMGMEFGVLMYRSIESLKQFRQQVIAAEDSPRDLQQAFLQQDCLFLTFDPADEEFLDNGNGLIELHSEELGEVRLEALGEMSEMIPTFGNLHPLEGMRSVLYDEEAIAVLLTLQALHKFFGQHLDRLSPETFPALTKSYRLPDPKNPKAKVSVKVSTLPDVAAELAEMSGSDPSDYMDYLNSLEVLEDDSEPVPVLLDDLVPKDAMYSLGAIPTTLIETLRLRVSHHQPGPAPLPAKASEFPVIMIQTSRPKANELLTEIQAFGGVKGISFNPGEDPSSQSRYDLAILHTNDGKMHLLGEFRDRDPVHLAARRKWDQRCKKTKGQCGLVVAMGLTGKSRGNPALQHMLGFFEARSLSSEEVGLGTLQLLPGLFDEL